MLPYKKQLKDAARKLRTNPTDAERKLWRQLCRKQVGGFQFYRQKPVGRYIVDFYCSKLKLVIEVDGGQHFEEKQILYDKERTTFLAGLGLKVLRFSNLDVLKNMDGVMRTIIAEVGDSGSSLGKREAGRDL